MATATDGRGAEVVPETAHAAEGATPHETTVSANTLRWGLWALRRVSKNRLLFWLDLFFQLRDRGKDSLATERAFRDGQIDSYERARRHARQGGELVGDVVGGRIGFWLGLIVGGVVGGVLGGLLAFLIGPFAILTALLGAVVCGLVAALAASLLFAWAGGTIGRTLALRGVEIGGRLVGRRPSASARR